MILRHVVMMKFNDDQNVERISSEIKQLLEALVSSVEPLKAMEVGLNISKKPSAYHLVLTADFDDEAGLDAYRSHPDHVKILNRMKDTVEKVAAVDYFVS